MQRLVESGRGLRLVWLVAEIEVRVQRIASQKGGGAAQAHGDTGEKARVGLAVEYTLWRCRAEALLEAEDDEADDDAQGAVDEEVRLLRAAGALEASLGSSPPCAESAWVDWVAAARRDARPSQAQRFEDEKDAADSHMHGLPSPGFCQHEQRSGELKKQHPPQCGDLPVRVVAAGNNEAHDCHDHGREEEGEGEEARPEGTLEARG